MLSALSLETCRADPGSKVVKGEAVRPRVQLRPWMRIIWFCVLATMARACHAVDASSEYALSRHVLGEKVEIHIGRQDLRDTLNAIHMLTGVDIVIDKDILSSRLLDTVVHLCLRNGTLGGAMEWLTWQLDANFRVCDDAMILIGREKDWIRHAKQSARLYHVDGLVDDDSRAAFLMFLSGYGITHDGLLLDCRRQIMTLVKPELVQRRMRQMIDILRERRTKGRRLAHDIAPSEPVRLARHAQPFPDLLDQLSMALQVNIGFDPRHADALQVFPLPMAAPVSEHLRHLGRQCGLNAMLWEAPYGFWLYPEALPYPGWRYGEWSWTRLNLYGFHVRELAEFMGAQRLLDLVRKNVYPRCWAVSGDQPVGADGRYAMERDDGLRQFNAANVPERHGRDHVDYHDMTGYLVVLGEDFVIEAVAQYLALLRISCHEAMHEVFKSKQ